MTEGGDEMEEGNRFSFFKNQTREESDNEANMTDVSALPDVSNAQTKRTPRNEQECKQCDVRCKKSRGEENPFSFKRFLQTGASRETSSHGKTVSGHHIATLDLASDLPDFVHNHQTQPTRVTRPDCQLPDFTLGLQTRTKCNHSNERESVNNASQSESQVDMCLPDFTLVSSVDNSSQERLNNWEVVDALEDEVQLPDFTKGLSVGTVQAACCEQQNDLPEMHLPDFALELQGSCDGLHGIAANVVVPTPAVPAEDDSNGTNMQQHSLVEGVVTLSGQPASGQCLPDFLSDYPVSVTGKRTLHIEEEDQVKVKTNGITKSEFIKLQDENRQLSEELGEEKEKVGRQTARLREALNEIEVIRKREMEDTAALENMVQQVEANLITTTRRAVNAETTATRLEEEVSSLQKRVQSLQFENDALQMGSSPTDLIKEQVKSASKQLSTAADQAELTLQQLLTGVQTIKLVSTSLASIGKMSEINSGQFQGVNDPGECGASGYSGH